jgi:hypothetical protein
VAQELSSDSCLGFCHFFSVFSLSPARSWPSVAARFLRDPFSTAGAAPVLPAATSFTVLDLVSLSRRVGLRSSAAEA